MSLRGRFGAGCLGRAVAAAMLAVGLTGSASASDGPATLKTTSDADALANGVKVAVGSPKSDLELVVKSSRNGPRLTQNRASGGRGQVSLPLSKTGKEVLAACGARQLTVYAVSARGRLVASDTARMDRTVPQCGALATANRCETIAAPGSNCLFPWPSNHFTVRKRSSATGREVALDAESMPTNRHDVHVDPTELDRSDGFSPGVSVVTHVPGLDTPEAFDQTGAAPLTDMEQAFRKRQPIVLIDAKTGKRKLIWSEPDANATSPENTDLIIRVGKNLKEGHRYIVAMRRLRDASGDVIPAPPGFAIYRDRLKTDEPAIEKRRHHFERIFKTLRKKAGIHRGNLYDAWDFTVASTHNIAGRMLHIRNDGLAQLGDDTPGDGVEQGHAPAFTITDVETVNEPNPRPGHEDLKETDPEHTVQNVREVAGTFEVPCYLDQPGCPSGSRYNLGPSGLPLQMPGNTYTANFTCNIPRSAVHQTSPQSGDFEVVRKDRTSMYGHGLFGDAGEVHTENVRQLGDDHNVITCATDFIGMAEEDVGPEAVPALLDISNFPPLADRLQQGFLDFIYLGRLMSLADGFASSAAFRFGGKTVIDTGNLFYYGNSQGGIAGGALTAIEPDLTRSVLYVPGMNYSTLLTRSVDFEDYALLLYPSYQDESVRPLLLSLIQMEWDRGEPNGYANHMTDDPLPGTPAHKVLIEMAYGDHQVSNVATEVEARTIGAPLRRPALDPGRAPSAFAGFFPQLPTLGPLTGPAAHGNGFFVWDIGPKRPDGMGGFLGTDSAPITNTAPNDSYGVDPHDTVIDTSAAVRHQIAQFIKPHGTLVPVCGHHPCYAAGWHGPGS